MIMLADYETLARVTECADNEYKSKIFRRSF